VYGFGGRAYRRRLALTAVLSVDRYSLKHKFLLVAGANVCRCALSLRLFVAMQRCRRKTPCCRSAETPSAGTRTFTFRSAGTDLALSLGCFNHKPLILREGLEREISSRRIRWASTSADRLAPGPAWLLRIKTGVPPESHRRASRLGIRTAMVLSRDAGCRAQCKGVDLFGAD